MTWSEDVYYFDTSALVKRYVSEPGSEVVDEIFKGAYRGINVIAFSYWNMAEAAVVFDKYERRLGLDARNLLKTLLREVKTLVRLRRIVVVGISPSILRSAINLVLKHHVYIADALQIVSAHKSRSSRFVTGDKTLATIAEAEGLEVLYTS